MPYILPAGKHYGEVLHTWDSRPFIISAIRYPARTKTSPHANELATVVFVLRGGYRKKLKTKVIQCEQNTVLYIPAKWPQADEFWFRDTDCLVVDCSPSFMSRIEEAGTDLRCAHVFSGSQFAASGAQLHREFKHADSASGLVFESIVLGTFANACRTVQSSRGPRPPAWLARTKEILHDRLAQSLTLGSVANEVNIHPVHLAHEFRRFFKITPGEYLRRTRVEFAAKQLIHTKLRLSEIALASGFGDQAHFSKTFRRVMHLSPTEFRDLIKGANSGQGPLN